MPCVVLSELLLHSFFILLVDRATGPRGSPTYGCTTPRPFAMNLVASSGPRGSARPCQPAFPTKSSGPGRTAVHRSPTQPLTKDIVPATAFCLKSTAEQNELKAIPTVRIASDAALLFLPRLLRIRSFLSFKVDQRTIRILMPATSALSSFLSPPAFVTNCKSGLMVSHGVT